MTGIDWSKAPEDAEYARKVTTGVDWYKRDALGVWVYMAKNGEWSESMWTSEKNCEQRPTWTGEGLPPVGAVCEWKEKIGFSWVKATVLFITEKSVVMRRKDGFEWQIMTDRTVFRPIRTPEQIAAEEREKGILQMAADAGHWWKDAPFDQLPPIMAVIYDAGYRKQASPTSE